MSFLVKFPTTFWTKFCDLTRKLLPMSSSTEEDNPNPKRKRCSSPSSDSEDDLSHKKQRPAPGIDDVTGLTHEIKLENHDNEENHEDEEMLDDDQNCSLEDRNSDHVGYEDHANEQNADADDELETTEYDETSIWEANAMDENDDSIIVTGGGRYSVPTPRALSVERARRDAQTHALSTTGWSPSEIALFHKVSMRGFEPLIPKAWERDFPMLPTALFTQSDAFVRALNLRNIPNPDWRGAKALNAVLEMGVKMRDKVFFDIPPESYIRKTIQDYIKWSWQDIAIAKKVGWERTIVLQLGGAKTNVDYLQRRIQRKLESQDKKWKSICQRVGAPLALQPAVFGILASHTIMVFISLVPATATSPSSLRTIAMFDYSNRDYDVWNGFALAILVCHCRNELLNICQQYPVITGDRPPSPDPDL